LKQTRLRFVSSAERSRRGPNLAGVFGSDQKLTNGQTVIADDEYIRNSILNPQGQIVEGYQPIMPTFKGQVTEEQLNSAGRLYQIARRKRRQAARRRARRLTRAFGNDGHRRRSQNGMNNGSARRTRNTMIPPTRRQRRRTVRAAIRTRRKIIPNRQTDSHSDKGGKSSYAKRKCN
jgi:hypothetical protein